MIIETRITRENKLSKKATEMGIVYQHEVCGMVESHVTNGEREYWADGIEGTTLVDAKFIKATKSSPFTTDSKVPSFIADKIERKIVEEFEKVAIIINDKATEWDSFLVITNTDKAVEYFTRIAIEAGMSEEQYAIVVES